MKKTTLYIIGAIIALAVLYALVVGIRSACFGRSHGGGGGKIKVFSVSVE